MDAGARSDLLFETERLCVRLPTRADAVAVAAFYRQNREHLQPWSPTFHPGMFAPEFWAAEVGRRQADFESGREVRAFLFGRHDPSRAIGNVSLSQIVRGVFHACTLGYALAADAQGHGYMVEAVRGTVAYAFGPLGLHRVMANYMPRNRRSAAVLRHAGFVVEGYARDYLLIDGRWEDHVLSAITNPGWTR
ncbi:MAG TPA: GNAT family N-acetyltransferase [Candidatus Dormibacteraeota bacterium]|nr:GNAT family N-acetyltransferase [Candidatus Dormibacteraeota bacterium]